jgi:hypothetical protein
MKTKLQRIEEAIKTGNIQRLNELTNSLTNDDIVEDMAQRGYLKPGNSCNICGMKLHDKYKRYGVGPCCYSELATMIVKRGHSDPVLKIIDDLKNAKKRRF